eukprot:4025258-Amphidinium_carterae.2
MLAIASGTPSSASQQFMHPPQSARRYSCEEALVPMCNSVLGEHAYIEALSREKPERGTNVVDVEVKTL